MTKPTDDPFTTWRRSYKRLRVLEAELVSRSRSGEDPVIIARLYDKVEALREQTTELFHLAQTAGMGHEIPVTRLASMTLEPTPSEFGALHEGYEPAPTAAVSAQNRSPGLRRSR